MRHPGRRWAVLLVAVAVAAAACYWVFDLERQSLAVRERALAATAHATTLDQGVADARRALAAMASPGQAAVSWSRQATAALDGVREHLTALAASSDTSGIGSVSDSLDKLVDAAGRVREHAVNGKTMAASDVAFGEALPLLDTMQGVSTSARARIAADADAAMQRLRGEQVLGVATALAALLMAGFVLVGLPAPQRPEESSPAVPAGADPAGELAMATGSPLALREAPLVAAGPTLDQLAAACADLAALTSEAGLPAALTRVAAALAASGVVVWFADRDRRVLTVAAATGYDPKVVARFGAVSMDDDNPTSRAAATAQTVVSTAAGQPAAVAAPLVGPDGVVGVLSAELTAGPARPDVAAAARVLAAQLAAVLAPAPESADAHRSSVTGH